MRPLLANRVLLLIVSLAVWRTVPAHAQLGVTIDIEQPPISYSDTEPDNPVSRLIAQLREGQIKLKYDRDFQYLPSLLEALDVPAASQTLVFSKTSLQVRHISRRNPRAIYFNDDVYVGWVRGSSLMELSVADPNVGSAFYTVEMNPLLSDESVRPQIHRAYYDCLSCHATSMTGGVPGHTIRSVMTSIDGSLLTQRESFISDHTSPVSERFGGWYVTGRHGEMAHMGNAVVMSGRLDRSQSYNRLSLRDSFDTFGYPTPYSDIVALMVLQHQTQMHNEFVKADFSVRKFKHDHPNLQRTSGEFQASLSLAAKPVVRSLLFCDEAELTDEVRGTVLFRSHFEKRGPSDSNDRTLREFDLKKRLFRYPCSYLIYSESFERLEPDLRSTVLKQLHEVLASKPAIANEGFSHLDRATRQEIHEILLATHKSYATFVKSNRLVSQVGN